MKFYESGDSSKPVIFLFSGTCCLYSSFEHVLDGLHSYFYTVIVSMMDLIQMRKQNFIQWKNPDIRRHNMQHEELFCCHSAEWVKEVKKSVEGDRQ